MNRQEKFERRQLARSMRSEGMTLRAIGKKLGMSNVWVSYAWHEFSIPSELILVKKRRRINYASNRILCNLGIEKEDFHRLGVTRAKTKAKRNFRKKVLELGLEQGDKMRILIDAYRIIQRIKYPPFTPDNCDALLRVMGGFMTTREVDYGLNGPV